MPKPETPICIHNCPVAFRFSCDKDWQDLQETEREGVRYCESCERKVHLISTDEELGRAIRTNQCIAWQLSEELEKEVDQSVLALGEPLAHLGDLTRHIVERANGNRMPDWSESSEEDET